MHKEPSVAALDMFEWFAKSFYPIPDKDADSFLKDEKEYLFSLRNENERQRYVENLIQETMKATPHSRA
jgi:hypothetical protein